MDHDLGSALCTRTRGGYSTSRLCSSNKLLLVEKVTRILMNESSQDVQKLVRAYRADPPQRYSQKYARYLQRGGMLLLEKIIPGFVSHGNASDMARFFFFCLAFDQIRKESVPGDIAELGVYRGNTASVLASFARTLDRTAFFLDTFEGFDASDLSGVDSNERKKFVDTSLEAVRAFVGDESSQYIKGHFPGTTKQLPADAVYCLVHIDCDLYAPITSGLEYFYPRMAPGGFLVVHDYSSLSWAGSERAVDEFFADKAEPVVALPDGGGSVVIRKARTKLSNWLREKKQSLFTDTWTPAGQNSLADILGAGWSGPEKWGVWGVGQQHELEICVKELPAEAIAFEADVAAPLMGSVKSHDVDVLAQGEAIATWHFDGNSNRGVRRVILPRRAFTTTVGSTLALQFRPHSTVRPSDIEPDRNDDRQLGLALFAIRRAN